MKAGVDLIISILGALRLERLSKKPSQTFTPVKVLDPTVNWDIVVDEEALDLLMLW